MTSNFFGVIAQNRPSHTSGLAMHHPYGTQIDRLVLNEGRSLTTAKAFRGSLSLFGSAVLA
eukprot:scaffold9102_cov157-Skeletonema_dohrnii-CCMP3373.AAC.12